MRRRDALRGAAAAALAPLAAGAATAARASTPGLDAPPEPGPPRPLVLPAFETLALANGLQIVVAPRRALPLVTATVLVRSGREADPAGRAGLATLAATVLTRGARRGGRAVGATALAREAEALGGALESAAGWRSTAVSLTVTTPRLPAALALLADVVRTPLLAADELEHARAQALDGLRVALASPGPVAGMVARRLAWGRSPYGASATPASLQRIARENLQRLHAAAFRPDRAALLLAGDLDADGARALAQRVFGGWARPAQAFDEPRSAEPAPLETRSVLVDMPGSGQAGVVVTAPFVAADDPERRIAEVASAVLGGGYSARLNQQVRIRRGLSYGVFAAGEAQAGGGVWTATAQTQPATAGEVLALLRSETLRLAAEPPEAAELAARQATLAGAFARRLETTQGLAAAAGALLAQGRPLAELARYVDEVMAVTPEQVQRFAARRWTEGALRAAVAGDLQAAGEPLRTATPGALLRSAATLDLEAEDFGR